MRTFFILSCVSAIALASAPALANPIVNGNFEAGHGTDIPGWLVLANSQAPFVSDSIQIAKGSDYNSCCNVGGSSVAALANQFATFGSGNVANNARLYQDFVLAAPGTYTLEFDFGAVQGTQRMAFALYDQNAGAYSVVDFPFQTGGQNLDTLFNHFSYTFTTNGGAMSLQFDNYLSDTNNVDAFLDNVSIAAVPEPATWAMMIGGFALIGASLRRRSSQATVRFA